MYQETISLLCGHHSVLTQSKMANNQWVAVSQKHYYIYDFLANQHAIMCHMTVTGSRPREHYSLPLLQYSLSSRLGEDCSAAMFPLPLQALPAASHLDHNILVFAVFCLVFSVMVFYHSNRKVTNTALKLKMALSK